MFTICVFDVFIYVFYSHRDIYSIVLHVCNVFVYLRYEYTSYTHIIDSSVCILYILHIYPIHIYIYIHQLYNVYIVVIYKSNAMSIYGATDPAEPKAFTTGAAQNFARRSFVVGSWGKDSLADGMSPKKTFLETSFKGQLGLPLTVYPWYLLCSTLGFLGIITHKFTHYIRLI